MNRTIAGITAAAALLALSTVTGATPAASADPCATTSTVSVVGADPQRGYDYINGAANRSPLLVTVIAPSTCDLSGYPAGTMTVRNKSGDAATIPLARFDYPAPAPGTVQLHGSLGYPNIPTGKFGVESVTINWLPGSETYPATQSATRKSWQSFTNDDRVQPWLTLPSIRENYADGGAAPGVTILAESQVRLANRGGTAVAWGFRVTCPKGQHYTLDVEVAQMNNPNLPSSIGEDWGNPAEAVVTGTCTGKEMKVPMVLPVVASPFAPTSDVIPWVSTSQAAGQYLYYSSYGTFTINTPPASGWCNYPNCAGATRWPRVQLDG